MRRFFWLAILAIPAILHAQAWGTLDGKTVGTSAGNISTFNGATIGTSTGNIFKWNGVSLVAGGGGAEGDPYFTITSSSCAGTGGAAASCTLGSDNQAGDLLILLSKSSSNDNSATVTWSFSGTSSCTPTTVLSPGNATWQDNGSGHFITSMAACIITSAGANTPVATWTLTDGTFTDIEAIAVRTKTSWKSTFLDAVSTPVKSTTSSTSCSTGAATTTNANDFVMSVCQVFNAAQTWGTLSGYTNLAGVSGSTTGVYYKPVTATGSQSATVPLSAADYGLGFTITFASNP